MLLGDAEKAGLAREIRMVAEFATYEGAVRKYPPLYEDSKLVASRLHKARQYYSGHQSHLIGDGHEAHELFCVISRADRSPRLRVLDFGGGFGPSYGLARGTSLVERDLRWAAVDLPLCVQAAREFETKTLRFFETIEDAQSWLGGFDLVHVSSVLQYLPEPEAMLRQLLGLGARWVMLMRTVLDTRRKVQIMESPLSWEYSGRMPTDIPDQMLRHVCTTMARGEFHRTVENAGYRLAKVMTVVGRKFQADQFLFEKA